MLEVRDLSFSYGKNRVLDRVSFCAGAGECLGILGNNGAGKSTLITCINRINIPEAGEILLDGIELHQMSRLELARSVSYVAQKNEMTHSSVFDAVLLGRRPYIRWAVDDEDLALCEQTIERLGLSAFRLRPLDELSGGELQKVMLARALVQQPKLLLLDEPTSNLDPRNQYEMLALVRELAREQGLAVLIVIHDLNLALRSCDRFLFLKGGSVYACGDADSMTPETIRAVYDMEAEIIRHGDIRLVVPYPP